MGRASARALAWASIALLGAALYASSLDVPFVLDDHRNIADSPWIRVTSLSPRALWDAGVKSPSGSRPLSNATFALNYYLGGYDVVGYHAANAAIHVVTALLVFGVARRTLALFARTPGAPRRLRSDIGAIAFLAALLFLAHPVQTQAVTYIVQRMTSLAAAWYLLALWLYLEGRSRVPRRGRVAWFAAAVVAWFLALASKQIAATLPALLLLYEVCFFRPARHDRSRWPWLWIAIVALATVAVAAVFLGGDPGRIVAGYAVRDFGPGQRLLTQLRVVVFYLSLCLLPLPSRLNLLHDFPPSTGLLEPVTTLASLVAVTGALGLAVALGRRNRLVSFCVLWFFLHLAIESSVIGLEMVFEHRLYLPLFGVSLLVAYGIFRIPWPRPAIAAAAAGLVVALCVGTVLRNQVWRDEVSFWSDVVAKSPGHERAYNGYGRALLRAGRLAEASRAFEQALAIDGKHTEAHYNLGVIAHREGRPAAAARHYEEALATDPTFARAYNNLGLVALQSGDRGAAAGLYRQAVRADPSYALAWYNLAAVRLLEGREQEAADDLREVVRFDPDHAEAHFQLAALLERGGRRAEALYHYAAAFRLDPEDATARRRIARLEGAASGDDAPR